MGEGIVILDNDHRIVRYNGAAIALLGLSSSSILGALLSEIAPYPALASCVTNADVVNGGDAEFYVEGTRFLHAYSREIPVKSGKLILVVLSDITRLRRLEDIRRDFVANVSHELKTPVTSIKGFVETLLDGALSNPVDAERFLKIVAKQADRLNNIFEDLLTLARLEQQQEGKEIPLSEIPLVDVIRAAVENAEGKAQSGEVSVNIECPKDLRISASTGLLEQAISNLIENALKYSDSSEPIQVRAKHLDAQIVVEVEDHGTGIEPLHLPRLFERFYRVDTARSRKGGGTGLGLSIVKHIAEAHGGHASVKSVLGQGSTFSISIPDRELKYYPP